MKKEKECFIVRYMMRVCIQRVKGVEKLKYAYRKERFVILRDEEVSGDGDNRRGLSRKTVGYCAASARSLNSVCAREKLLDI